MTKHPSPIRILHAVGHLSRGGIENWLYQTIRRMDPTQYQHHILVLTGEEEPFTAAFREAGIHIHPCPTLSRPHRFAAGLRKILRHQGPCDVLHAHGFSALTTAALTLSRAVPIRILHGHNDLHPRMARAGRPYRAYAHASLALQRAFATHAAACSKPATEWTFGPSQKAELLIGTDLEACMAQPTPHLREQLGIPHDRFVLAQVARFTTAKNHVFTLALARELEARRVPFHLLLIGDGPLRQSFLANLESIGLADRCTWLGNCENVPEVLASAVDLVLLPSLNEGLGLAAIEAQAAALPVLVADTVPRECDLALGLVDFLPITQGPKSWADKILQRLDRPNPDLTLAQRNKILTSRFHIGHSVDRLAALYQGTRP